jgi:hypothetical protein
MNQDKKAKVKLEDQYRPSNTAVEIIGSAYTDLYKFKNLRDGNFRQIQGMTLENFWKQSRELFWNSTVTKSEDLEALGLDFSIPFIRKEVLDYTGRVVSLNMKPELSGDALNQYAIQVLQAMHKKWRLKGNDKVEKFWQLLYGITNGTVCTYVGYDIGEREMSYLSAFDSATRDYEIEKKKTKLWNDAFVEIVPLEEIYLEKIHERNIQKQNKVIRVQQMEMSDFRKQFPAGPYANTEHVMPGSMIAEDSLYLKLLDGTGITTHDKVQVLRIYDTGADTYKIIANGVWINELKGGKEMPNPFTHKGQPFVWAIPEAIDEKFAYGMSTPFKLKDTSKILNTSYSMLVERELRAIDPPIITSDFEAPQLIFGQNRVVPVNDINAYKEFQIQEATGAYYTMMNSVQGVMGSLAQGGFSQIGPSRQPRSAREILHMEQIKQQALGNTMTMYYDLVRQEILLLLKTMIQFYSAGQYATEGNLVRTFTVPNFALSQGGIGNLEVRFVKNPADGLKLYFEAAEKSIKEGRTTEIVEVPVEMIQNLEFYINDIKLEPEKSTAMERAEWNEQVLQPLLNVFIPAGVADVGKTYLRWAEKHGEHPSSFTSEEAMPQIMSSWSNSYNGSQVASMPENQGQAQGQQPQQMGRQGSPAQSSNLAQSNTGVRFGGQGNQGGLSDLMEM